MRARALPTLAAGAALALGLTGCSLLGADEPERNEAGEITESASAAVTTIKVGDCLDAAALDSVVETVPTIPCGEPHDGEVFASTELEDGEYPGDEEIEKQSTDYCFGEFDAFAGISLQESELDVWPLYPQEAGWDAGDHEVLCLVVDAKGGLTESLEGAKR